MEPLLVNSFGKNEDPGFQDAQLGREETETVFGRIEKPEADFGGKDIFRSLVDHFELQVEVEHDG